MSNYAQTEEEVEARKIRWRQTSNIQARDHWGLVAKITKAFVPYDQWAFLEDTMEFSDGLLGLHQAMEGFDPAFGYQFSTYATYCVRNEIIKWKKHRKIHSRGEVATFSDFEKDEKVCDIPARTDWDEIQEEVDDLLALLPGKTEMERIDREIFIDWYLNKKTLDEIAAEHLNPKTGKPVGRERIRQRRERAEHTLKKRVDRRERRHLHRKLACA